MGYPKWSDPHPFKYTHTQSNTGMQAALLGRVALKKNPGDTLRVGLECRTSKAKWAESLNKRTQRHRIVLASHLH